MEQEIILQKESDKLSFLKPIASLLKSKFEKAKVLKSLKKTGITLVSILLFLGLWHLGSKALYNKEAAYKIEKHSMNRGKKQPMQRKHV